MSERAWRTGPITWHPTVLAPILQAELLLVLGAVTSALVDEPALRGWVWRDAVERGLMLLRSALARNEEASVVPALAGVDK